MKRIIFTSFVVIAGAPGYTGEAGPAMLKMVLEIDPKNEMALFLKNSIEESMRLEEEHPE